MTTFYRLLSATTSFSGTFQQAFSSEGFVDFSKQGRQARPKKSSQQQTVPEVSETAKVETEIMGIFHCPNEGCIKVYQRHSALEKHMSYGKCELHPERASLLDQAKQMYHVKFTERTSAGATSHDSGAPALESDAQTNQLPRGWALEQTKKTGRFNEAQKQYLDDKFEISQQTGHKLDPVSVARDMRYAKNAEGNRLFTRGEFLTAQQIQSYFSRQAGKLRHQHAEDDNNDQEAAVEQQQYWDTRTAVIQQVQLQHPVTYDSFDLCAMYHENKLNQFCVAMLKHICEYFNVNKEQLAVRKRRHILDL